MNGVLSTLVHEVLKFEHLQSNFILLSSPHNTGKSTIACDFPLHNPGIVLLTSLQPEYICLIGRRGCTGT